MAHVRQSRPDYGLGLSQLYGKRLYFFYLLPSRSEAGAGTCLIWIEKSHNPFSIQSTLIPDGPLAAMKRVWAIPKLEVSNRARSDQLPAVGVEGSAQRIYVGFGAGANLNFFFCSTLLLSSLELSDTKVYEP